jgi:hypothetical protein
MPSARQAVLAGVLCRIGEFSVDSFQERLKLQKTVYLLQAFGIYLGYGFNWYLYGPYSPGLTRDAYEVVPKLKRRSPSPPFFDPEAESRFATFEAFLGSRKDDPKWLEQAASLHLLSCVYGKENKNAVFDKMAQKQPYLTELDREQAWQRLARFGLI